MQCESMKISCLGTERFFNYGRGDLDIFHHLLDIWMYCAGLFLSLKFYLKTCRSLASFPEVVNSLKTSILSLDIDKICI
jgi:hypothetical protein